MTDISEVIAWKFNDQPGMSCREINGVMTIVEFPGGMPSAEDQEAWVEEYENKDLIIGLEPKRKAKLEALAEKRWQVEVGGFTFNGVSLPSDATMSSKLSGTISLMQLDPNTKTVDWEITEGVWQTFDQPTITAIGVALALHIKGTFDHKRVLAEAIAGAKDEAELDAIDINAGW